MFGTIHGKRIGKSLRVSFRVILASTLLALTFFVSGTKANAQQASVEQTGLPPNSTFMSGDVDTVNLQNGNLHIDIPIYKEKQRGGKSLTWELLYDSQTWLKTFFPASCTGTGIGGKQLCNPPGTASVNFGHNSVSGWRLASPTSWGVSNTETAQTCVSTNEPYTAFTNWIVTDPQGTEHLFPLRQEAGGACKGQTLRAPALDGSGIVYDLQANIIYLKDGTQISPTQISDTNGNLYTFSNNHDSNGKTPVTVTNGPTVTYTTPLGRTQTGFSSTTYTVLDPNGVQRVYTVAYEAIDVATNYCGIGVNPSSPIQIPCGEFVSAAIEIKSLTLPDGRAYTFTYNDNSPAELASITLPTGAQISYSYGQIVQIQLGAQNFEFPNYVIIPSVATRTVTDDGTSQTWSYSESPTTSTVTDPVGNVATHAFSTILPPINNENPTTSTYEVSATYKDAQGSLLRTVTTAYASEYSDVLLTPVNVRPISVTTTLDNGQITQKQTDYETFSFNDYIGSEVASRLNPTEIREYDYSAGPGSSSPGGPIRKTDYTYLHNVTPAYAALNIVDKRSTVVISNGAGNVVEQTAYEYDNYSHANQTFSPSNAIQHNSAFTTSYITRGNVTAVSKWRSTDGTYLTTTRQYDDAGNILSTIDPLGRQSFLSYTDAWANSGCVPSGQTAAFVTKMTNAKGQVTTSAYDACTGSLASTTDPNLQTTSYTYDFMGRVKLVTRPAGGGTTTMCYSDDPSGACYSTSSLSSSETDQISGSTNLVKTTLYDSLGREKETQVNSDPNGVVYADTQYDQGGRAYKTSNPYRSGDTVYWTTSGYDGLGRVTSVTKADGSATATVYSGNTTTVTDEAGNKRASQSNAMGQLTEVLEDPTGLDYETDYQNDVLGNVLQITQKGGTTTSANWRVRTFTFNSLGQLLCSANPEIGSPSSSVATCPVTDTGSYIAGTTRYQYDNDGELISKIAPLENQTGTSTVTTNFAYDVLGRITTKTYTDGTPAVSYAYDGSAITACTPPSIASPTNLVGRVSAMCDASGATVWSYDALGRTLTESRKIGAATDQIGYTYYLNGAVNTITYPRAGATTPLVVTYNVDASGRTYSAVGSNGVTYAQVTSTYASGAANVSLLGSNIQITDTYNSRLQPLATTAEQISTTNTLFNKTYNFHLGAGDNGNLFGVVDGLDALDLNRPNGSVNYGYDTLNRIASAATLGTGCTAMAGGTLNWGSTYTMDAWGNLTAQTPTLCTAVPLSTTATSRNQLAVATYDSAGNITQNNGLGYSYDAGGRLTNGSGTVYVYDGMGERVEKGGSKLYWKGVGSTALVETNASDLSPTQYIFFNGARIARIDPGATTAKYYVADNLGSTAAETDSLGNLLNESLYFPYGVERVIAQSDTGNNYKFTGKERDAETGLDDFGARYYASSLGRFMTPDWDGKPVTVPYASFGDPQTLNLYSYVENGPLNKVDADGHMAGGNNAVQPYLSIFDSGNCIAAINGGCTGSYLEDSGNLGAGYAEASIDGRESANDEAASVENVQATEAAAQQQQNQKLSPIDRVALKAEAGALKLTRQALASGHSAEYGGLILSKDSNGSLSSTSPIHTGETSVDIDSISVPRGYTVVGEYHTHPSVDCCESEGPSVQDVNRLRTPERASRIGYVGSAFTGQVSRYTQLEPITGAYDTHTYGTVIGTIP